LTIPKLKNTEGVLTDVDIYWSGTTTFSSMTCSLTASSLTDYPDFAIQDGWGTTSSSGQKCTIQHLDPELTYDITFYGAFKTDKNYVMEVTINGESKSYNAGGSAGEGLVTFEGVRPNENGKIDVSFACMSNNGYLNVIDMTAVGPTTLAPTFSPEGKYIFGPTPITITSATEGAVIYYTVDGSIPTIDENNRYTEPVIVDDGTVLRAIAVADDVSHVTGVTYVVRPYYNRPQNIPFGSAIVDGDLSEWQESEFVSIDQDYYPRPQITSASYAVRWDGTTDQFYVAVKVLDENPVFLDACAGWDQQDGIEIYLHTTGGEPYDYEETQSSAQQYVLGLKANHTGTDATEHVWVTFACEEDVPREAVGFQAAGVQELDELGNPTGWLFYEVKMTAYESLDKTDPANSIISPLSADDTVGIDVIICDKYNGGFGMKGENTISPKHSDWRLIGLHKLSPIPGDANKDDMVNVGDLGILAANYGRNLETENIDASEWWGLGDFNGDGEVNVGDLGILAANYGSSSSGFAADYAKVFGAATVDKESKEERSNPLCSGLGLPMIAGFILAGLMLVKLKE
jgi:hypothetical protein